MGHKEHNQFANSGTLRGNFENPLALIEYLSALKGAGPAAVENLHYLNAVICHKFGNTVLALEEIAKELTLFPHNQVALQFSQLLLANASHVPDHLEQFLNEAIEDKKLLEHPALSFSVSGEDIVAYRALQSESEKGLFLDIGSFHPIKFSNTYLLYLHGWRGINVEPNKDLISLYAQYRPEDITLQAIVSDRNEERCYYKFAEPALNGTHESIAGSDPNPSNPSRKILGMDRLHALTINQILDQYIGTQKFDLLTIDTEGLDTRILLSMNFERYRPKALLVELSLEDMQQSQLTDYLMRYGYRRHSYIENTALYFLSEER